MPIFKPFRGVRPDQDLLETFPTTFLDSYPEGEIERKITEKDSYLHMIKPYLQSKSGDVDKDLKKVRQNFENLLKQRKLLQDPSSYYLYEQIHADKTSFRGLLGLVSLQDFWDTKIKRHESTIPQKKEELAYYLEKVNIQAEPVLLTYPSNPKIEMMMNHDGKGIPVIKMTDENGIQHKVWRIDNRLKIQQYKEALEQINAFYIADGHHRIGAASLYAKKMQDKNRKSLGVENYNFVYSFIVSNQSIKINDYNRYLTSLNGLTPREVIESLSEFFLINDRGEEAYFPSQKHHISMYIEGKFYSLLLKNEFKNKESGSILLDHDLFNRYILKSIFKIEDPDSSPLICYTEGSSDKMGILKLKEQIDSGKGVIGFGIHPISFQEILRISDQKIVMPPKCTYIEPKLVSALVMYDTK